MCAVVFYIQGGVQVENVVGEFHKITTSSGKMPTHTVLVNASTDFKDQVIQKLTTAIPSFKSECVLSTEASMPVQGCFAIKCILDAHRISSFVVFTVEDSNLAALLTILDTIFSTLVYCVKTRVYGNLSIDTTEMLANVGEDFKAAIKKTCSEHLKGVSLIPQETVEIIKSDHICNKTFLHGFSTRKGGCSSFPSVSSLNLAYIPAKMDPSIVVEENRRRLLKAAGATSSREFVLAKAVHGDCVWVVGSPEPPGYDAIVCDKPGVVIAAPAADCVTMVFADAYRAVCAVAHSGWKGTLANIARATVHTMMCQFGCNIEDIRATVGPSIGVCCYEVGVDVEKLFSGHSLLNGCMEVVEGKQKRHLNLQNAVALQLGEVGISPQHIDSSPSKLCTYCNDNLFFSYRRDGRPFGTHVGFIGLR